jgi:hypothetical protein
VFAFVSSRKVGAQSKERLAKKRTGGVQNTTY